MRYTTPITTLAVNSSGERQLEAHHLDDNFTAQDNAIQTITRALFASGGVAKAGTVTLTGLNLRVQDRVGVTLDTSAALHVTDLTLDLTTLPAGKGTVVMTTDPVTVNRTYTDIVTQENLTDTMTVRLGRLYVMGAGTAGVTLDAQGYPVVPQNTVPVAHVTRTAGGAILDEVLNPAIQVNSSVTGPAGADGADGADGVSVTGAEINGSGHLILTLSDATTIDAGAVGNGGGAGLPSGGTTGQVLTKQSGTDGDATWQTPATGGGGTDPNAYSPSNKVPLIPGGTPSFSSLQSGSSTDPSKLYRMLGPQIAEAPFARTFNSITIPLRSANITGAETIMAVVVDASFNVVKRWEMTPAAGASSVTTPDGFSIPSGVRYGVLVGCTSGAVDTASLSKTYSALNAYPTFPSYVITTSLVTDSAPPTSGGTDIKVPVSPQSRDIILNGAGIQKGVSGPLDPVDFPISTTADAPRSSGFMVVNDAAKTASLYWKFSDGTVKGVDLA